MAESSDDLFEEEPNLDEVQAALQEYQSMEQQQPDSDAPESKNGSAAAPASIAPEAQDLGAEQLEMEGADESPEIEPPEMDDEAEVDAVPSADTEELPGRDNAPADDSIGPELPEEFPDSEEEMPEQETSAADEVAREAAELDALAEELGLDEEAKAELDEARRTELLTQEQMQTIQMVAQLAQAFRGNEASGAGAGNGAQNAGEGVGAVLTLGMQLVSVGLGRIGEFLKGVATKAELSNDPGTETAPTPAPEPKSTLDDDAPESALEVWQAEQWDDAQHRLNEALAEYRERVDTLMETPFGHAVEQAAAARVKWEVAEQARASAAEYAKGVNWSNDPEVQKLTLEAGQQKEAYEKKADTAVRMMQDDPAALESVHRLTGLNGRVGSIAEEMIAHAGTDPERTELVQSTLQEWQGEVAPKLDKLDDITKTEQMEAIKKTAERVAEALAKLFGRSSGMSMG